MPQLGKHSAPGCLAVTITLMATVILAVVSLISLT